MRGVVVMQGSFCTGLTFAPAKMRYSNASTCPLAAAILTTVWHHKKEATTESGLAPASSNRVIRCNWFYCRHRAIVESLLGPTMIGPGLSTVCGSAPFSRSCLKASASPVLIASRIEPAEAGVMIKMLKRIVNQMCCIKKFWERNA